MRIWTALAAGLVWIAAGPAAPAQAAPKLALVIGNANYELASWTLANPANDAAAVSVKLESLGFQVTTLLDADEDEMEDAVGDFRRTLREGGEDAIGLFYFSGHGVQADGRNWLMPIDFDGTTLDDVIGDSLRLGDVLNAMERAGNRMNFVLLDACRNDPLPRATRDAGRGLAAEARQRGMVIAYAAAPGQAALDNAGGDLSPFTEAFVDLIDGPYHAGELFPLVAGRVQAATQGRQQPWVEIGVSAASREDFFYFNPDALIDTGPSVEDRLAERLADMDEDVLAAVRRQDGGQSLATLAFQIMYAPGGGDDDRAFRLAAGACERGSADGCNLLGGILTEGIGVAPNLDQAVDLFTRACEGGSVAACGNIGFLHRDGRGVEQDPDKAVELMGDACEANDAMQCANLAEMFDVGIGIEPNADRATELYGRACYMRHLRSCLSYGEALLDGRGVAANPIEARQLFRTVCQSANLAVEGEAVQACAPLLRVSQADCEDKDDAQSCREVAIMMIEGRGIVADPDAGVAMLDAKCEAGQIISCLTIAQVFSAGQPLPQDRPRAVQAARRAYELGDRVTAAHYLQQLGEAP